MRAVLPLAGHSLSALRPLSSVSGLRGRVIGSFTHRTHDWQATRPPCRQLGVGGGAAAATPRRRRLANSVPRAGPGGGWEPQPDDSRGERQQRQDDQQIVLGIGIGLTVLVVLALKLGGGAVDEAEVWDFGAGDASFGAGDGAGALLWAASLWFCSPLQLLLIFFGNIEADRPSDWVLRQLGQAAKLDVDAIDYRVPGLLQAAAVALFAGAGVSIAAGFQVLLGDATWSVSTGLGACMAAGMYEVGRPVRLSVEEAQAKEKIWQDFARFADGSLVRRGRCHESEIVRALQRAMPKYRAEGAGLDSSTLRALVRNWAPEADRSSNGYYRGVSLQSATNSSNNLSGSSGNSSDGNDRY